MRNIDKESKKDTDILYNKYFVYYMGIGICEERRNWEHWQYIIIVFKKKNTSVPYYSRVKIIT